MHDPITGKNIFLLSIAYFTICCNLNPSKKGIGEKNYYVNEIMWESSWYVSSNWCGGSAMHFYWNIWKAHCDNNDRSFLLVWNDIPWNISRVTWSVSPAAHTARSDQLLCARVTAFSSTSLFLELFWSEFWISFKFHIPVSKTYRPKNDIFSLLITFCFPFR